MVCSNRVTDANRHIASIFTSVNTRLVCYDLNGDRYKDNATSLSHQPIAPSCSMRENQFDHLQSDWAFTTLAVR